MAQSEELFPQNAGKFTDEFFRQAQELAIDGKKEAFDLYLKSAELGKPASAYLVSQYYCKGLVKSEPMDALFWATYASVGYDVRATEWLLTYFQLRDTPAEGEFFKFCVKKADQGSGAAMFLAGMAHYTGLGTYFEPAKAYGYFCRSADAGNLDGKCQKALCLMRGSGTERNLDEGLKLLKEVAGYGNIRAGLKYAYCLEHGYGIGKDREAALKIYTAMADNKVPIAMYEAGRCCLDGIGASKDESKAYAWFFASQAFGCIEGDFGMSRCMLGGIVEDKREEGLKLLKACTEKGCVEAMVMLGQLYLKGSKIVKKNEKAAMDLFKQAADLGRANSEVYMSQCYSTGDGVRKDPQTAVRYALRAAAHGSSEGCFLAGNALLSGTGIKKDEALGFSLCCISADEGYMKASYAIANCYARGRGVQKNPKKALEIHKELAAKGFVKSMVNVAEAYYHGDGVQKDIDYAFRLFKEGAEKDNAICQFYLGECYDEGNGVKKDPQEAIKWYKKAAAQGHVISAKILEERKADAILKEETPITLFEKDARSGNAQAMFILGRCYLDGINVEKDESKAKEWFLKAKKRGYSPARRALETMEKKE